MTCASSEPLVDLGDDATETIRILALVLPNTRKALFFFVSQEQNHAKYLCNDDRRKAALSCHRTKLKGESFFTESWLSRLLGQTISEVHTEINGYCVSNMFASCGNIAEDCSLTTSQISPSGTLLSHQPTLSDKIWAIAKTLQFFSSSDRLKFVTKVI